MSIPAMDMIVDDSSLIDGRSRFESRFFSDSDSRPVPDIVAVIPAYNEGVAIGSVVLGALQYADRVIVVDDGSKDETAKLAELAGAQVIRMEENGGKAKALIAGLKAAEKLGCQVAVALDGDGQHRSEDILSVAIPVLNGDADLMIGSRFIGKEKDIPRYRVIGQKIINSLSNAGSKTKVTDSQSGLRALGTNALKNLNFASNGYNVESDMITHFAAKGLTIKEVPIEVSYDVPNGHKKGALAMGLGLLANAVSVISYRRPLLMFGVPGVSLAIMGLMLGFLSAMDSIIIGNFLTQSFLSIGTVMVGTFFCVSALTLNSLTLLMNANYEL